MTYRTKRSNTHIKKVEKTNCLKFTWNDSYFHNQIEKIAYMNVMKAMSGWVLCLRGYQGFDLCPFILKNIIRICCKLSFPVSMAILYKDRIKYITYNKFRCEIISVKKSNRKFFPPKFIVTENCSHRIFNRTYFGDFFIWFWKSKQS